MTRRTASTWSEAPLWRFELIEDSAGAQVRLFGAHHAVSGAHSIMMVLGELDAELGGRALDRTPSNRGTVSLLRARSVVTWNEGDPRYDVLPPKALMAADAIGCL